MYYLKNAEKKWCPCDGINQQKNFIYAPMDKPKIPVYGQVNVRVSESPRRLVRIASKAPPVSSQSVSPDVNVNIPSALERYSGFVPFTARQRERFVDPSGDSLIIDYGNAMIPPSITNIPAQQYDAAIAAFYETLGMPVPSNEYDFDATPHRAPIPIEATAYASLPAEYAENFTPLKVNKYGTVSKWK